MAGLFQNDPNTPEGKFPLVFRRDGTIVTDAHFVMLLKDPCTEAALKAYADCAEALEMDPAYVADIRALADRSADLREVDRCQPDGPTSDPDAPRHRKDHPTVIAIAKALMTKSA